MFTHSQTYTHTHTYSETYTYIHTHTHSHIHTHTHIQKHMDTHIHTHSHTYTRIHMHTHTYTHSETYRHTHIHTRIHARTHRHNPLLQRKPLSEKQRRALVLRESLLSYTSSPEQQRTVGNVLAPFQPSPDAHAIVLWVVFLNHPGRRALRAKERHCCESSRVKLGAWGRCGQCRRHQARSSPGSGAKQGQPGCGQTL